jgi:hypothetical protein
MALPFSSDNFLNCMKLLYLISFQVTENVSICFSYIESGSIITTSNPQPPKQPTDELL